VKINDPFKYDETIFMDRYMWTNVETTTKLRVDEGELRDQMDAVQTRLQAFNNFNVRIDSGLFWDVLLSFSPLEP